MNHYIQMQILHIERSIGRNNFLFLICIIYETYITLNSNLQIPVLQLNAITFNVPEVLLRLLFGNNTKLLDYVQIYHRVV